MKDEIWRKILQEHPWGLRGRNAGGWRQQTAKMQQRGHQAGTAHMMNPLRVLKGLLRHREQRGQFPVSMGVHTTRPVNRHLGHGLEACSSHLPHQMLAQHLLWPGRVVFGPLWAHNGLVGVCRSPPPLKSASASEGKNSATQPHLVVPDTGYNTVPITAIPYSDYSSPLGDHLTPAVKEKIWTGQYIDFYELLNRQIEVRDIDKDDEKIKEKHRRKRPDRDWNNWVTGFTIYSGVLVKAQPWKASALFQYFDIIRRAQAEFEGLAWLRYDEAFRMRSAIRPEMRWDETHPGLWLQHMTPAKCNLGDRFDCGHLNIQSTETTDAQQREGQPRWPCYEFNNKGTCVRSPCRFNHVCIACGGKHPKINCSKAGSQRQDKMGGPNKKSEGGTGVMRKGNHAN
ncbi:uncharacterized protein LOC140705804 [Pogona vitticeps]